MKRKVSGSGAILAGLMVWWSRVILFGLLFWGFKLYMTNHWGLMPWPW